MSLLSSSDDEEDSSNRSEPSPSIQLDFSNSIQVDRDVDLEHLEKVAPSQCCSRRCASSILYIWNLVALFSWILGWILLVVFYSFDVKLAPKWVVNVWISSEVVCGLSSLLAIVSLMLGFILTVCVKISLRHRSLLACIVRCILVVSGLLYAIGLSLFVLAASLFVVDVCQLDESCKSTYYVGLMIFIVAGTALFCCVPWCAAYFAPTKMFIRYTSPLPPKVPRCVAYCQHGVPNVYCCVSFQVWVVVVCSCVAACSLFLMGGYATEGALLLVSSVVLGLVGVSKCLVVGFPRARLPGRIVRVISLVGSSFLFVIVSLLFLGSLTYDLVVSSREHSSQWNYGPIAGILILLLCLFSCCVIDIVETCLFFRDVPVDGEESYRQLDGELEELESDG